jgi:oxygen-independent coproporphyrinogen-3 oxidase
MGYTSRQVAPLIGLGVSAIGDSWSAFAQNEKLLETYVARVEKGELPILRGHLLNREDEIIRRHILDLMTKFETQWSTEASGAEAASLHEVPARLSELALDGLVKIEEKPKSIRIQVTEEGRAYLRNVCMAFDLRLVRRAPATELFSKTI